jgi:hypothetical protein
VSLARRASAEFAGTALLVAAVAVPHFPEETIR